MSRVVSLLGVCSRPKSSLCVVQNAWIVAALEPVRQLAESHTAVVDFDVHGDLRARDVEKLNDARWGRVGVDLVLGLQTRALLMRNSEITPTIRVAHGDAVRVPKHTLREWRRTRNGIAHVAENAPIVGELGQSVAVLLI
jgi:hypothetical protein